MQPHWLRCFLRLGFVRLLWPKHGGFRKPVPVETNLGPPEGRPGPKTYHVLCGREARRRRCGAALSPDVTLASLGAKRKARRMAGLRLPVFQENLERAKGFEPSTPTLARSCSTPELHPHPRDCRLIATCDRLTYAKCGLRMQQPARTHETTKKRYISSQYAEIGPMAANRAMRRPRQGTRPADAPSIDAAIRAIFRTGFAAFR